eukprot:4405995-Pyramimonas_sp.AAC.1
MQCYCQNTWRNRGCIKAEQHDFSSFSFLASEAFSMCSNDRCARKELDEVSGGSQVDGLPPVPVSARWRAS